jgi:hypothetical protein
VTLPYIPQPAGGSPLIVTSDIEIRFAYAVNGDSLLPAGIRSPQDLADGLIEVITDGSLLTDKPTTDVYVVCDTGICPGYICQYFHGSSPVSRHPLAARGMVACGVYEVKPSAWLRHLRSVEPEEFPPEILASFHPATQETTMRQLTYHHMLFAFRDSTLEFITDRLSYELVWGAKGIRDELQRIKWGEDCF